MTKTTASRLCSLVFVLALACRAMAANIAFPVPDSALGPDIFTQPQSLYPGFNTNLSNNTVTVNSGTIPNNVFGGMSDSAADVFANTVLLRGGSVGSGIAYALPVALMPTSLLIRQKDVLGPEAPVLAGGSVYGCITYQGDCHGNTVTVGGGLANGNVYGGFVMGGGGNVYGNQIAIVGGLVNGNVNGGLTYLGTASGNTVTVSGGVVNDWVIGGTTLVGGDAVNNMVTVTGGTFPNYARRILGGWTQGGNSNDNKVIVSGILNPTQLANVSLHGGDSVAGATNYNSVTVSNSPGIRLLGITGGITNSVTSIGNQVSIIDSPGFAVTFHIWGGRLSTGINDTPMNDGNTLSLINSGGSTEGVLGFENYNFLLPATLAPGNPLVAITGATPVDMTGTNVNIMGIAPGGALLQPGDTITLFSKATGLTEFHTLVPKGAVLLYDFRVFTDGALKAQLAASRVNPDSEIVPHGPSATLAFLTQGADLIAGLGAIRTSLEAEERRKMPTLFAVAAGGEIRHKLGSRVDVKAVSLLAGMDWLVPTRYGELNLAAFFETGSGDYDSRCDSWRPVTLRAEGDMNYYGGGLLGRLDLPNGMYVEASGRAGGARVDFSSDNLDIFGRGARYNYDTPYFGAHSGLGHIWKMTETASLDVYAKYLWVRLNSHDAAVLGDPVHFKADDSRRGRLGARFNYAATARLTAYAGAAYEYEFSGKTRAFAYGFGLPEPSLEGGSGIGELGFFCRAGAMTVELGAKGYVGRREGVTGRFMIGYDF